jgi:class 3 adenylate cyclase/predicted ATPase
MDVAAWLRGLGLEQYAPAFRDNDVDGEVLPELTADDLISIGVTSVGHRRKLLAAIAAMRLDLPSSGTPIASTEPMRPGQNAGIGAGEAERRQLTVMFCDLVGSTKLSTQLDPEDLREVISAYHAAVADEVEQFGGFVARYMGDGVLVYFGYPHAHEYDAEQALRAGLALVERVGQLPLGATKLAVRVGVATGVVVVGGRIGEGSAQEKLVVGETPNLAARLQALAEPHAVVIAAGTRRLVGDLFEFRDLGAVELKGIAGPIQVWQVLRPSIVASRVEALRGTALTRLIGRDEEISLLLRRWARAKAGDGQVVLVSGEPGIGKTRITEALEERLHVEPHLRLRYFCSPYHKDSALYPFVDQLGRAAEFARDDLPSSRLDKLGSLLARTAPQEGDVALLADLLSLPALETRPLPNLSPQQKKVRILGALIRQLEGLARRQPVVLIFEDTHWIDPTSRELLDLAVERVRSLPVLLIVTFRPEFLPPWTGQPQVTMLALNRLDRHDRTVLVEQIAGNKTLPDEVIDQIVDRTDGVPLFVEELTKSVLESGLLSQEVDRYVLDGELPPFAIPTTLHDSLMARLDRLGSLAREVAQTGSAIGREFSYKLVAELTGHDQASLINALREVEGAGLIYTRGEPPDAICRFKHALVQEAAYSMLLRGHRQVLHARIVDVFETQSFEMVETQSELVAHHCAAAGLVERAVMYWGKAGQREIARSALMEAIAHLKKALGMLRALPPTREHKQQELGFQIALGGALIASKGHGAGETGQAYARAYELGREVGDAPQLFRALAGTFVHHHVRTEVDRAQEAARELLRLAEEQADVAGQVMAHRALGDSLLHVGRFSSARGHLERALSLFGLDASPVIVGEEIGVAALAFLSLCTAALGFPAAAAARSKEALERARRRVLHPHTLAVALAVDCRLHWVLRNPHRLKESSDELFSLALEHGLGYLLAQGTIYRGGALALEGRFEEAVSLLEEGVASVPATGAVWLMPFNRGALAIAYQRTGRVEEARSVLDRVFERGSLTRVGWMKAELHRLEADLALSAAVPNLALAEASLNRAIATAQQQGAKWWELRAVTSLARLRCAQGKSNEARNLLAPVYGWFTEGFDTADLIEAKALLDELT